MLFESIDCMKQECLEFSQLGFDELELLNLYRQLDEKHKHYVIAVIKNIPL